MSKLLVRLFGYGIEGDGLESLLHYTGDNTGNMIWYESAKETIKYDSETFLFSNDNNIYIVPMANNLSVWNNSIEKFANKVKANNELVLIGLGAQLTDDLNTPQKLVEALPVERKKAMQFLSTKTNTIGVRGEITAECLELLNIKNYRIIGCPSFYSNPNAIWNLCNGESKKISEVAINLQAYGKKQVGYFLNAIKDYGMRKTYFVMQDMRDLPKTKYEKCLISEKHMRERFQETEISSQEMEKYIRKQGRIFFSKREWIDFFQQKSISCSTGMRFHGNMAALLAGVPAIWITHDSRTIELCQTMQLPNYSIYDIKEDFSIYDIQPLIENYNLYFWKNYKRKYAIFCDFLKDNKLEIKGEKMDGNRFDNICE